MQAPPKAGVQAHSRPTFQAGPVCGRLPAMPRIKDPPFIIFLVAITAAFLWILQPFFGAILWSIAAAILFGPLHLRLRAALGKRQNLAAALMVLLVVLVVILPIILVGASLGQQAAGVYDRVQSGELDFALY